MTAVSLQTPADVASDYATQLFIIQQQIGRLATCTLVKVVACTNAGGVSPVGTVDVQPLINQLTGDQQAVPHGQLFKLPYCRLQGGANALILDPQPGDIGIACFASRDISTAKTPAAAANIKAGEVVGVNPGSLRQYDMSDGLYVGACLNGIPTQYVQFSAAGIKIHSPTKVTIEAPAIELIGPVTASQTIVATGNVTGQGTSLHTHTHSGVTPGGGNSGPPV